MPGSPPRSEHNIKTSPESYETRLPAAPNYASRDATRFPGNNPQSTAPTLPPVTALTGYGMGAPPPAGMVDSGSPVSLRPFLQSMLNHPAEVELARPAPRISQSPGRSVSTHGPYQTPLISPRIRKRKDETSPGRTSQMSLDARPGRRMLTPKSPSLRSVSQSVRASPSAGSRTSNPLGDSRVYTADQGDISAGHVPPLPPIAVTARGHYNTSQYQEPFAGTTPFSNSTTSYPISNPGYAESPSGSSSMADRENTSPFRPGPSDSVSRTSSYQQQMGGPDAQTRAPPRAYGAGQPAYQMQISTDQGPVAIPVEIDLQQASKSADEKRKRNAGASARFRQRRKEKEQAASAHISDLQRELRSLSEQRDFYRGERNFLRDIIVRTPGVQLPPRPPSPQTRSGGAPLAPAPEPLPGVDYGRRDMTEPSPAQRRRTSDYQPSFASGILPPSSYPPPYPPPPAPAGQGYALPPPTLPTPMHDPRGHPPNSYIQPHTAQQAPPPPGPLRPQQHDPFRRDVNPR